jgi:hypothetical protein
MGVARSSVARLSHDRQTALRSSAAVLLRDSTTVRGNQRSRQPATARSSILILLPLVFVVILAPERYASLLPERCDPFLHHRPPAPHCRPSSAISRPTHVLPIVLPRAWRTQAVDSMRRRLRGRTQMARGREHDRGSTHGHPRRGIIPAVMTHQAGFLSMCQLSPHQQCRQGKSRLKQGSW